MKKIGLSRNALDLILRLSRSPSMKISGAVLNDDFCNVANELIDDEWFSKGRCNSYCDPVTGVFRDLDWDSDNKCYRYFNEEGWNRLSICQVEEFSLNLDRFLTFIKSLIEVEQHFRIERLIESLLWYLGQTRIGNSRVNFYFMRRASLQNVQFDCSKRLKKESERTPSIIITDSPIVNCNFPIPRGFATIYFEDLLDRVYDNCIFDQAMVLTILKGKNEADDTAIGLNFSDDYRLVMWNGEEYKLTKTQSAAIEALDKAGGKAHKDHITSGLRSNQEFGQIMRNRVDGIWVVHPLWGALIKSTGDGHYYFDI